MINGNATLDKEYLDVILESHPNTVARKMMTRAGIWQGVGIINDYVEVATKQAEEGRFPSIYATPPTPLMNRSYCSEIRFNVIGGPHTTTECISDYVSVTECVEDKLHELSFINYYTKLDPLKDYTADELEDILGVRLMVSYAGAKLGMLPQDPPPLENIFYKIEGNRINFSQIPFVNPEIDEVDLINEVGSTRVRIMQRERHLKVMVPNDPPIIIDEIETSDGKKPHLRTCNVHTHRKLKDDEVTFRFPSHRRMLVFFEDKISPYFRPEYKACVVTMIKDGKKVDNPKTNKPNKHFMFVDGEFVIPEYKASGNGYDILPPMNAINMASTPEIEIYEVSEYKVGTVADISDRYKDTFGRIEDNPSDMKLAISPKMFKPTPVFMNGLYPYDIKSQLHDISHDGLFLRNALAADGKRGRGRPVTLDEVMHVFNSERTRATISERGTSSTEEPVIMTDRSNGEVTVRYSDGPSVKLMVNDVPSTGGGSGGGLGMMMEALAEVRLRGRKVEPEDISYEIHSDSTATIMEKAILKDSRTPMVLDYTDMRFQNLEHLIDDSHKKIIYYDIDNIPEPNDEYTQALKMLNNPEPETAVSLMRELERADDKSVYPYFNDIYTFAMREFIGGKDDIQHDSCPLAHNVYGNYLAKRSKIRHHLTDVSSLDVVEEESCLYSVLYFDYDHLTTRLLVSKDKLITPEKISRTDDGRIKCLLNKADLGEDIDVIAITNKSRYDYEFNSQSFEVPDGVEVGYTHDCVFVNYIKRTYKVLDRNKYRQDGNHVYIGIPLEDNCVKIVHRGHDMNQGKVIRGLEDAMFVNRGRLLHDDFTVNTKPVECRSNELRKSSLCTGAFKCDDIEEYKPIVIHSDLGMSHSDIKNYYDEHGELPYNTIKNGITNTDLEDDVCHEALKYLFQRDGCFKKGTYMVNEDFIKNPDRVRSIPLSKFDRAYTKTPYSSNAPIQHGRQYSPMKEEVKFVLPERGYRLNIQQKPRPKRAPINPVKGVTYDILPHYETELRVEKVINLEELDYFDTVYGINETYIVETKYSNGSTELKFTNMEDYSSVTKVIDIMAVIPAYHKPSNSVIFFNRSGDMIGFNMESFNFLHHTEMDGMKDSLYFCINTKSAINVIHYDDANMMAETSLSSLINKADLKPNREYYYSYDGHFLYTVDGDIEVFRVKDISAKPVHDSSELFNEVEPLSEYFAFKSALEPLALNRMMDDNGFVEFFDSSIPFHKDYCLVFVNGGFVPNNKIRVMGSRLIQIEQVNSTGLVDIYYAIDSPDKKPVKRNSRPDISYLDICIEDSNNVNDTYKYFGYSRLRNVEPVVEPAKEEMVDILEELLPYDEDNIRDEYVSPDFVPELDDVYILDNNPVAGNHTNVTIAWRGTIVVDGVRRNSGQWNIEYYAHANIIPSGNTVIVIGQIPEDVLLEAISTFGIFRRAVVGKTDDNSIVPYIDPANDDEKNKSDILLVTVGRHD